MDAETMHFASATFYVQIILAGLAPQTTRWSITLY